MRKLRDGVVLFFIGVYALASPYLYFAVQPQLVEPTTPQVLNSKVSAQQTDKEELLNLAAHPFYTTGGLPDPNELFSLMNAQRQNQKLSSLNPDGRLAKIAQARADDMAARGYFGHKTPEGHYYYHVLEQAQLSTSYSCENLALDSKLNGQTYINQWLTSTDGHKECMLYSSLTHVGIGVARLRFDHSKGYDTEAYVVVAILAD